jgi:hypothetical protein
MEASLDSSLESMTIPRTSAGPVGAGLRARPCPSSADCCERVAARNPLIATRAAVGVGPYSYAGGRRGPPLQTV